MPLLFLTSKECGFDNVSSLFLFLSLSLFLMYHSYVVVPESPEIVLIAGRSWASHANVGNVTSRQNQDKNSKQMPN